MYFWNEILHVSDSSSAHHQEFFIAHTAMTYTNAVCAMKTPDMTYTSAVCAMKNS